MGPLWAGSGHPVGRVKAYEVKICVPHRRKSGLSPSCPMLRIARMTVIMKVAQNLEQLHGF